MSGSDNPNRGLVGVARDARTLTEVLDLLTERGFDHEMRAEADAKVQCLECQARTAAASLVPADLYRLEGASDPDDMLAVVALTCPACGSRSSLVLGYGPEASEEDSAVLRDLPQTT
jgi:hypothetical protein